MMKTDIGKLVRVSPAELDEVLAQIQEQGQTELVLIGPRIPLGPSPDNWPEKLRGFSIIIQLSNFVENLGQKIIPLTSLKTLFIWGNRIGNTGAEDISNLTQLTSLNLYLNDIGEAGARAIANLKQLTSLNLMDNNIGDTGAKAISNLKQLTSLDLSNNYKIGDSGAKAISKLTKLSVLRLNECSLTNPAPLANLTMLKALDIRGTKVTDLSPLKSFFTRGIPAVWEGYSGDPSIIVHNCPLVHPPPEVVKQGNEAVLNYFREIEAQGVASLFEAKVLIVGEGGAGKTSLLRRLYRPELPLPSEDETTKGIDIHHYDFENLDRYTFRLNVWDFGGQQIYHATHQFFLTKRSLYILLDDTRKDHKSVHDEGFKYWLEVIEILSDHSPVLIFQNEKGGRSKTIDEAGIKGRFPNVKEVYRGNLQDSNSTSDLYKAIEFFVQKLPHIGESVPAKWVSIRSAIKEKAKTHAYISQQDYFDLYRQHLDFDQEKALHLSRYLHDLGVFLHFQDDRKLSRTVILQNEWATEAVFKILDDETVKARLGRFTVADCNRIWVGTEYRNAHLELLALMEKFELCYLLADSAPETWLAPQLLSPAPPATLENWPLSADLVMFYRYEFLPKGMLSRLIYRMHRFVRRPELAWTNGALFEREQTQVLVRTTDRRNEISLRARGTDNKALLSVIASELDALNASFNGLQEKVRKWVPCVCEQCGTSTSPELFEQGRLLQRKKDHRLTVECPASYALVSVLQLLDGLILEQLPGWAHEPDEPTMPSTKIDALSGRPKMQTVTIFLASSEELRNDRDEFDLYFRQQNDSLREKGLYLKIVRWENFLDSMAEKGLQTEYHQAVRDCDIFVSLFKTKTGKYTEQEFDVALQAFKKKENKKPRIYTFFKDSTISTDAANRADLESLWNFKDKLKKLGHYPTPYENTDSLKLKFKDQLDKLITEEDPKGRLFH